ncbi:hypothetical protein [Oleiphilus messinensis]|nr:hypothetical protein [Oleiphilus messinensis]
MNVFKQKIIALGIHFTISLSIIVLAALVVQTFWYPGVLFEIDGGIQGLTIVFWVDVVLGPILTFCVYKKNKKGLTFDLALIALLQLSCLSWGLWQTYTQRPLLLVLTDDSFRTLNESSFDFHSIPLNILDSLPGTTPKLVWAKPEQSGDAPTSYEKLQKYFQEGPLYVQYKQYVPMHEALEYLKISGFSSPESLQRNSRDTKTESNENSSSTPIRFFSVEGKYDKAIIEIDTDNSAVSWSN